MFEEIKNKMSAAQEVVDALAWTKKNCLSTIQECEEKISNEDYQEWCGEEYYRQQIDHNNLVLKYIENVEKTLLKEIKDSL